MAGAFGKPGLPGGFGGGVPVFGAGAPHSAASLTRRFQEVPGEENNEGRPWWVPLLPALIGGGVSLLSQLWQNKREDSAHQREMADLEKAGLNPALAAAGQGSQTGQVDLVGSALAVARAKAEIDLIKAQTRGQDAGAMHQVAQAREIDKFSQGRGDLVQAQIQLSKMNAKQVEQMLPLLSERAREEIRLTSNSARVQEAMAKIHEAEIQGRLNEEELAKMIGELGPWATLFLRALRIAR